MIVYKDNEFKAKEYTKTVYDPNKISTNQYIKLGIEAANNSAKNSSTGKLGHEWIELIAMAQNGVDIVMNQVKSHRFIQKIKGG